MTRADPSDADLVELDHDRTHRTLVLPALDEVDAVPGLAALAATLDDVVDRVVVLDGGSTDATRRAAREHGLEVLVSSELGPPGPVQGKGDSLWRAASLDTDVIVFRDADVVGVERAAVDSLARAVEPAGVALAKGRFGRLQYRDGPARPVSGRITSFVARPLLGLLAPELGHVGQPLSGQFAVRRDVLADLPIVTRYGVDVGLVLDVGRRFGPAAIVDVDVGSLTHRSKDDASLVPMAHDVAATILAHGRPSPDRPPPGGDSAAAVAGLVPCAGPQGPLLVRPPWRTWSEPADATTSLPSPRRAQDLPPAEELPMPTWLSETGATLMGIVNVNPDSFSDPRTTLDLDERLKVSRRVVEDGAAVVDLGAQSAATHLPVVDPVVEIDGLVPLVTALARDGIPVSVDTYKPEVAAAVLAAGAGIVNDYSGVEHPEIVEHTADHDAWYVLTHNRGRPKQRLTEPTRYADVTGDVIEFFDTQLARLETLGLSPGRVLLDPGVDLSKTPNQTLAVLRQVERIRDAFDQPQLWAISRKDVLGVATSRPPAQRDPATLAVVGAFAGRSRTLLRVHDVAGAADYLAMRALLRAERDLDDDDLLDPSLYREPGPPSSSGPRAPG